MSQQEIKEFMKQFELGDTVPTQYFEDCLRSAYKDRSTQIYFIWKKLQELYPEVDATKVIREASWEFGLFQGQKFADKVGPENIGPKEALVGQSSPGGFLVFEQTVTELSDDKAVKVFHRCPHCEALADLGCGPDIQKKFCREMLGACDYAICEPFPKVKIDFPTTIGDGEGQGCAMTITKKE